MWGFPYAGGVQGYDQACNAPALLGSYRKVHVVTLGKPKTCRPVEIYNSQGGC